MSNPITSVTIGDGDGGGAGTDIKREGNAVLEIWRNASVTRVPLTLIAVAPDLLKICQAMTVMGDHVDLTQGLPLKKIFSKNYEALNTALSKL